MKKVAAGAGRLRMLARASRKAFGAQGPGLGAAATYGCAAVGMADSHVMQPGRSAAKLHPKHGQV
eukprot:4004969-Alexandrium_andersonii.AAC.1